MREPAPKSVICWGVTPTQRQRLSGPSWKMFITRAARLHQDVGQGSGDPIPFPTMVTVAVPGEVQMWVAISCCLCTAETVAPAVLPFPLQCPLLSGPHLPPSPPGVPEIPKNLTEPSMPGMSQSNVKTLFSSNNYVRNTWVNLKITTEKFTFNICPAPYIPADEGSEA